MRWQDHIISDQEVLNRTGPQARQHLPYQPRPMGFDRIACTLKNQSCRNALTGLANTVFKA